MQRLRILFRWLFVLIVSKGLCQIASAPNPAEACTDEDYAIFSAALGNHKVDSLIILDHTATGYLLDLAVKRVRSGSETFYKDVPKDANDDFEGRNKKGVGIDVSRIKAPFETLSLSDKEAEKLFHRNDGWEVFHQKYPRTSGLVSISRPGFNRDHDRALLYLGESCGPDCAGGALVLLSTVDGKWKVISMVSIWTS